MNPSLLREMNRVMDDAAALARQRRQQEPEADLTELWINALKRLCSIVENRQLTFPEHVTPETLKILCKSKPWSYERFVAFVSKHPSC